MPKESILAFKVVSSELSKADLIVKHLLPDIPRSQVRALFQNDCVTANDELIHNPGTKLQIGDSLIVTFQAQKKYKEKKVLPVDSMFRIIFEDGHLMVVEKDAGILSVPARSGRAESLLDKINDYLPRGRQIEVVHRLDRETSGLLVFAKSPGICRKLKDQFEKRKPERVYDTFVKGHIKPEQAELRSFLATDEDLNQHSVEDEEEGKLAITNYKVEKYLNDSSWLKVKLKTGRRNQIRVHLSEEGHPVLGDLRYKRELAAHPLWSDHYLALHASTLGFIHPVSGKPLSFNSEMPARMKRFLVYK